MNADKRRFNPVPEFGKIIHRKGRKERKAHWLTALRHPRSVIKEKTLYYFRVGKTTEGTEDTENCSFSLCSLYSLWSIILAGIHCIGLNKMSLKKVIFLIEKDPKGDFDARALEYSIYGRGYHA